MVENLRPSLRLSFLSSEADTPVPAVSELLTRLRSHPTWDEASIYPTHGDFPRIHISWHESHGFTVHCFNNERSLGHFLVNGHGFSSPNVDINLGGQALERWPRELFVAEASAIEALEYFIDRGDLKPSLWWTGTGDFPRQSVWQGRAEREAWERIHRAR
jgi:hypothetical protein